MSRKIKITESKLKQIISESVKRILKENEEQKYLNLYNLVKTELNNDTYDFDIEENEYKLYVDDYCLTFYYKCQWSESGNNIDEPYYTESDFYWNDDCPVMLLTPDNKEIKLDKILSDKLYELIQQYPKIQEYIEEECYSDFEYQKYNGYDDYMADKADDYRKYGDEA